MRSYRIESQVDVLEVAVHAIGWYEANHGGPGPASPRFARVTEAGGDTVTVTPKMDPNGARTAVPQLSPDRQDPTSLVRPGWKLIIKSLYSNG